MADFTAARLPENRVHHGRRGCYLVGDLMAVVVLVTVELMWPTASAICSMSTPESDSTDTNVCLCSRGVQLSPMPARPHRALK